MIYHSKSNDKDILDIQYLVNNNINVWTGSKLEDNKCFEVIHFSDGTIFRYYSTIIRNSDYEIIMIKIFELKDKLGYYSKGKNTMINTIREYFKKHDNIIISIIIVIILDQYFLEGKFTDKIKELVEKFIDKTIKIVEE